MSRCKFVATDQPREIDGEPCPHRHCAVCGITHCDDAHPVTCPRCVGHVRDDLDEIVDMHARLLTEAVNRGWNGDREGQVLGGDAMVMLAMRWREQTGLASDGDHSHESEADPVPPLLTLATWEDAWRDHLGHETTEKASVEDAAAYLALMLTRMAQDHEVPFEEFGRDVRQARGRLEDVLHDSRKPETGAPCPECQRPLVHVYGKRIVDDRWKCPGRDCDEEFTERGYRGYVEDDHRKKADRLTAADLAIKLGIEASRIRVWGARGLVKKRGRNADGITLYDVSDAQARHAGEPQSA